MPLETATFISDLEPANPAPTDQLAQADEHLRLIKSALQATFPNITGPVTANQDQLNSPFALPVRATILWYGSSTSVPSGWRICDGSTVILSDGSGVLTLPDMRDRTAIGVGSTLATSIGATAGSATSTATSGSAGEHSHTADGGAHAHTGEAAGHALTIAEMPQHSHYSFYGGTGAFSTTLGSNSPPYANSENGNSGSAFIAEATGTSANSGKTSTTGGGNVHNHPLTINESTHTHTVSTGGAHQHSVTVPTIPPCIGFHYIMKV